MRNLKKWRLLLVGVLGLVLLGVGVVMGPRLLRVGTRLLTYWSMPVFDQPIAATGDYTDIIFLHHSTGQNLIAEGNLRALLSDKGYLFWDHDFNHIGLTDPTGTLTKTTFRIPGAYGRGNTDVDGLAHLFAETVTDPPANAFSRLMQHEIIILKSCFPNSAIKDEEMADQFKIWYRQMRDVMDAHPDHLFILITSPPLHPSETNSNEAKRARAMANWLASADYRGGHPNVFVFDFFDLLADPQTNTLRQAYWRSTSEADSHPNRLANEVIAPQLVSFIDMARSTYLASSLE